ncbi:MAG: antibiotic biosynthesis monooxygenase family protein [Anaerolineaceae bacterium]|jgi:antibiotic biosynthesis monooxygenase (ABM) superfamily enzyme
MIERHVTFDVHPEKSSEFVDFFTRFYRPAMAAMPGYIKADLLQDHECATSFQMVIRFENAETAAGWRSSEAHREFSPRLKAMHSGSHLQVYEVVA